MPTIRQLPPSVINKIAAGEVVERPASVVKELMENSLDAGATKIAVDVEEGGRKLIRVTDDGEGMTPEDALACFGRHATSKLYNPEDLFSIKTLGFRGEALPSIASVSRLTLETQAEAGIGTSIEVAGGQIVRRREGAFRRETTMRRALLLATLTAAAISALGRLSAQSSGDALITVDTGVLRGVVRDGAAAYLGIPYAAPPVGALRWREPQEL